jgi:hypothetical protein
VRRLGFALLLLPVLVAACTTQPDAGADGKFAEPHTVTVPRENRTVATFSLVSGATTVRVRTADLGDELYRATTPKDSGVVPRNSSTGAETELRLQPSNEPGRNSAVDITLTTRVRWTLRFAGGANTESLDLRGTRLTRLDVTAGTSQLEIWLPRPTAVTTAALSGGASSLQMHVPANVLTRVTARAGAGSVNIDGVENSGISPGQAWTPAGWAGQTARYDVDIRSGVGNATFTRY